MNDEHYLNNQIEIMNIQTTLIQTRRTSCIRGAKRIERESTKRIGCALAGLGVNSLVRQLADSPLKLF